MVHEFGLKLGDEVTDPAGRMGDAMESAGKAADKLWEKIALGEVAGRMVERVLDGIGEAARSVGELALTAGEDVAVMSAQFDAFGGGHGAGARTLGMLREMEKVLPESEKQLAAWTGRLEAAGMTDLTKLQGGLQAVASAEALVTGGGERAISLIARFQEMAVKGTRVRFNAAMLEGTGVSEEEFTHALGMTPKQLQLASKQGQLSGEALADAMVSVLSEKGTGPIAAQMDKLSTAFAKGEDMVRRMFEGTDVSPLVSGVKEFFSVFDDNTATGEDLKQDITGAFDSIMDVSGKAFRYLEVGFLQTIVWIIEADMWWKKHRDTIEDVAKIVGYTLVAAAGIAVIAFAPLLVSMASYAALCTIVAVQTAIAFAPFVAAALAIGLVVDQLRKLDAELNTATVDENGNVLSDKQIAARQAGVRALKAQNEAAGAVSGGGAGQAQAVIDSAPMPANAAGGEIMRPAPGEVVASVKPGERIVPEGGSGSGGARLTVEAGAFEIHLHGVSDPHQAAELAEEKVAAMFERFAVMMGAATTS